MSRFNFIFQVIFSCIFTVSKAQTSYILQGKVTNINNIPLLGASIILKNGDKFLSYRSTDTNGFYRFAIAKEDTISITVHAKLLGFKDEMAKITFNKPQLVINFKLTEEYQELKEIVIKKKTAITFKGDTTSFDLKAFRQGNEQTVEDIIKKLPGMSVDDNGQISFKGTKIETVLFDNENFYKDKYSNLTKRLNQKNIDTIEAIENYMEDDIMASFVKSGKTAINLKLKKDEGIHASGSLATDLGTGNRFDISAENISWKNKFKFMEIDEFGNTSQPYRYQISDQKLLNKLNYRIIPKSNADPLLPIPKANSNLYGKNLLINPNIVFKKSDKISFRGFGQYFNQTNVKATANSTEYFENQDLREFELKNQKTNERAVDYELETKVNINPIARVKNSISFTGFRNNLYSKDSIHQTLSSTTNKYLNDENFVRLLDKISFLKKIDDSCILDVTSIINISHLKTNSINERMISSTANYNAFQFLYNKNILSDSYIRIFKKNKHSLSSYTIGTSFNYENFSSDLNFSGQSLFNNASNSLVDMYLKHSWYRTFSKYSLLISSSLHSLNNQFNSNINRNSSRNQISPNLNLKNDYKISKKTNISLSFNYETQVNGIENRYEEMIINAPRSFHKNRPDNILLIEKTDLTLFVSYNDFFEKQITLNGFLMFGTKPISTNFYEIDLNHIYTTAFNGISKPFTFGNINFSTLLPSISSTFKLDASYSQNSSINSINSSELKFVRSKNTTFTAKLLTIFDGNFNGDISFSMSFSSFIDKNKHELPIVYNNKMNLYYTFRRVDLSLNNLFLFYANEINNKFLFSDFKAFYKPKNSKLSLSAGAINIFNQQNIIQQNRNNLVNNILKTIVNGRYLTAGGRYNF
jgi:hypothetical protein